MKMCVFCNEYAADIRVCLYTEYKYRQTEHRAFGPGGLAVRSFDVCVKLREVGVKLCCEVATQSR